MGHSLVWVVGDLRNPEFQEIVQILTEFPGLDWNSVPLESIQEHVPVREKQEHGPVGENQIQAAVEIGRVQPAGILVLQSRPYEYSAADRDQLFARAPFAGILVVLSVWAGSSGRTAPIWPPGSMVRVTEASEHVRKFLLPKEPDSQSRLAAREDHYLRTGFRIPRLLDGVKLCVISNDVQRRELIHSILIEAGALIVEKEECDRLVVDGPQFVASPQTIRMELFWSADRLVRTIFSNVCD